MKNKKVENLAYFKSSNVRILVDYNDYNIKDDNRLLIPFSYSQHFGLINKVGEVVVEPEYDIISDSCYEESDLIRLGKYYTYGYNRKTKDPSTYLGIKWGLIDSKGNFILDSIYKWIDISDDKKILTVRHMDFQYEVIDVDGVVVVPKGFYSWIDTFVNGLARVISMDGENKKWGIIDELGNQVLSLRYSRVWKFTNKNQRLIPVETIDEHGNTHIGHFDLFTREVSI